ncbi:MAG: hypothetical protein RIS75_1346, partial [Actinomycetota bacterium]
IRSVPRARGNAVDEDEITMANTFRTELRLPQRGSVTGDRGKL